MYVVCVITSCNTIYCLAKEKGMNEWTFPTHQDGHWYCRDFTQSQYINSENLLAALYFSVLQTGCQTLTSLVQFFFSTLSYHAYTLCIFLYSMCTWIARIWLVVNVSFFCVFSVGPFQSEALLVPNHCVFDHIHKTKECKSFQVMWSHCIFIC